MAENSKIEWTHHTFNPWRGCAKVSPGCAHCYAETMSERNPRVLGVWGPNGTRVVAAEPQWREPLKWDRAAKAAGERHRVFCASLADVFEDWQGPMSDSAGQKIYWPHDSCNERRLWVPCHDCGGGEKSVTMSDVRRRLFALIDSTPNLDWLLLTKRPENIAIMMPTVDDGHGGKLAEAIFGSPGKLIRTRPNLWLGVPATTQREADDLIPKLLRCPAAVRVVVIDPLLEAISLSYETGTHAHLPGCLLDDIHWVIVGGESGPGARPCSVDWIRSIVRQCKAAGVPVFVKQLGADPRGTKEEQLYQFNHGCWGLKGDAGRLVLSDRKGGDMEEWPSDLRVREFPEVR